MKRFLMPSLALLSLVFLFPGCGKASTTSPGRTDLNVSIPFGIANFDPNFIVADQVRNALGNIYETLYVQKFSKAKDNKLVKELVPRLATSHEVSKDGLTYTFKLRKGVKFHDGTELKSADVVFSVNKATASPPMRSYTEGIALVKALDDYTVAITLKSKLAVFLDDLSNIYIMNQAFTDKVGSKISEQTNGTGPYYLSESIPDQKYVLKTFKDYYGAKPKIPTISIKVTPDPSSMMIAFESGELDMVSYIPLVSWKKISESDQFKSYIYYTDAALAIFLNLERPPFDNLKLRQAINYALDRESINIIAYEGVNKPTSVLINPENVFGAVVPKVIYAYDPGKAKQLLAEAGFPDGLKIPSIRILPGDASKVAQVMQRNLADIGVTMEIEVVEPNVLFSSMGPGTYDLAILGHRNGYDIHYWRIAFMTQFINSMNAARFSDKTVDSIFEAAAGELDPAKRVLMYGDAVNIINDKVAYVPFVHDSFRFATDPKLAFDVAPESLGYSDLYWKN